MLEDFKRALARVQTDYAFYIECQTDPDVALADYDLGPDERSALTDPKKLDDMLIRSIRITISGTHDWVNRAAPPQKKAMEKDDRDAMVATEVEAIRQASTDDERTRAAVRLMELVD
jgi:hypothetical protein